MQKSVLTKRALISAASFIALSLPGGVAFAQGETIDFAIESQALSTALLAFNEQSGLSVAAPVSLVEGKTAPAVRGEMAPEEALTKLLSTSGLKLQKTRSGGGVYGRSGFCE